MAYKGTPAVVNAIKKFQTVNSLVSDGIFDGKSWIRFSRIIVDPTTANINDSEAAMGYEEPKEQ